MAAQSGIKIVMATHDLGQVRRLAGDVVFLVRGTLCEQGHLHFEPAQGLIEVLDPSTGRPALPGTVGTLVATPFPPFRQTTLLLRYDTEDLVRVLDAPPTCRLKHVPATGPILGKLRLAARHPDGWTTPRAVLEALEAIDAVPLPARCAFHAVPGGVAVDVRVRNATPGVYQAVKESLEQHDVPVRALRLMESESELVRPLPLRCDLREMAFDPTSLVTGVDPVILDPALAGVTR